MIGEEPSQQEVPEDDPGQDVEAYSEHDLPPSSARCGLSFFFERFCSCLCLFSFR